MSHSPTPNTPPRRPNIILILVDDMGFSDVGCYGSEIRTPNIDRLAAGGMVFSQMYNCARCCPTRASLLTGLYPHQAGVGQMTGDRGHAAYQGYLNDSCVTIAEALGAAGYRTCMSGKWHVGGPYDVRRPESWTPGDRTHPTPVQRGFDEHYGMLGGAGNYFRPPTIIHNDRFVELPDEGYYFTDAISDHAVRMIDSACDAPDDAAQPLFLYVAYTAPHWPLHALEEDIARYRGKYACGWDAVRTARHERLKATGLIDPKWPISPRDPEAPPFATIDNADMQDARMAVYAAQIDRMDQGLGRILDALRRGGIDRDTMVIFLSDNGGCHEFLDARAAWCDRLKTPLPGGREVVMGNVPDLLPGPAHTYQSYQRPWANASNTPFRLHKHWVHEGGIATPLIVHWPAAIEGGSVHHAVSHVIDLMPTCLDAASAPYPVQRACLPVTPVEGRSLLPFCLGRKSFDPSGDGDERIVYWEHEGNRAVRHGRWKLVSQFDGPAQRDGAWELYDLATDRTELTDLADAKPDTLAELETLYHQWADRAGVVDYAQLNA